MLNSRTYRPCVPTIGGYATSPWYYPSSWELTTGAGGPRSCIHLKLLHYAVVFGVEETGADAVVVVVYQHAVVGEIAEFRFVLF